MFQEVPLSHPNLPGIGPISGPVDYMSAALPKDIPLKITGGVANPAKPIFVVVQVKWAQSLSDVSSNAQLMAQLLTAQHDDT